MVFDDELEEEVKKKSYGEEPIPSKPKPKKGTKVKITIPSLPQDVSGISCTTSFSFYATLKYISLLFHAVCCVR